MDHIKAFAFSVLIFTFTAGVLFAGLIEDKSKALDIRVLKRTAVVILKAQTAVKANKVYTGDFAKAVRHQKYAKVLFAAKKFDLSMRHSLRARQLAYNSLAANKTKLSDVAAPEEKLLYATLQNDKIDKSVAEQLPKDTVKDEEIVSLNLDLTVNADETAK
jgi:ribosomal protein L14